MSESNLLDRLRTHTLIVVGNWHINMSKPFSLLLVLTLSVHSSCTMKPNDAKLSLSEIAGETSADSTTTETFNEFGIQISITDKATDSFVISESYSKDESTGENIKHSEMVRDTQRRLRIARRGELLVDTLLSKDAFKHLFNEGVMDNVIFGKYEVTKVSADTVAFLGVIGEPDTDFAVVAFRHYYNLKTKTFSIEMLDFQEEELE